MKHGYYVSPQNYEGVLFGAGYMMRGYTPFLLWLLLYSTYMIFKVGGTHIQILKNISKNF
jgi:hypothetical protein